MHLPGHSFNVYVDESGDEGLGSPGASRWFVLSSVVCRVVDDPSCFQSVRDVKQRLHEISHRKIAKPLHFRDLKHEQRVFFAREISKYNITAISVCIDKQELANLSFFSGQRLYLYATRLLLERISWFCRDNANGSGDGSAKIIFANRTATNYDHMRDHVHRLLTEKQLEFRGATACLSADRIKTEQVGRLSGLQVADAIAYASYAALNPNTFGDCESRYLAEMADIFYRHKGNLYKYGLKLVPASADEKRRQGEIKIPLACTGP